MPTFNCMSTFNSISESYRNSLCIFEKDLKFDQLIANDIWVRSSPIFIVLQHVIEDVIPIFLGKIHFSKFDAQNLDGGTQRGGSTHEKLLKESPLPMRATGSADSAPYTSSTQSLSSSFRLKSLSYSRGLIKQTCAAYLACIKSWSTVQTPVSS